MKKSEMRRKVEEMLGKLWENGVRFAIPEDKILDEDEASRRMVENDYRTGRKVILENYNPEELKEIAENTKRFYDILISSKIMSDEGRLIFFAFLISLAAEVNKRIVIRQCEYLIFIGHRLEKGEIIVEGDGGAWVGQEMKGGRVIIKGNASIVGKRMSSGEIVINGNALSEETGYEMSGGRIIVNGNVDNVGTGMTGGKIIIHGNVTGSVGSGMKDGEITVNGNVTGSLYNGVMDVFGGRVHVKGDVKEVTDLRGGEVVVEGDVLGMVGYNRGGKIVIKGKVKGGVVEYVGGTVIVESEKRKYTKHGVEVMK